MKTRTQKQKTKGAITDKVLTIAKRTGWDAEYIQRVLNVQKGQRSGDQKEVEMTTGFTSKHVSNVVTLKARNENVITIMEKIIAQRAERLKDAPLYKKSA